MGNVFTMKEIFLENPTLKFNHVSITIVDHAETKLFMTQHLHWYIPIDSISLVAWPRNFCWIIIKQKQNSHHHQYTSPNLQDWRLLFCPTSYSRGLATCVQICNFSLVVNSFFVVSNPFYLHMYLISSSPETIITAKDKPEDSILWPPLSAHTLDGNCKGSYIWLLCQFHSTYRANLNSNHSPGVDLHFLSTKGLEWNKQNRDSVYCAHWLLKQTLKLEAKTWKKLTVLRVQRGSFLKTILSYSNEICKIQSLTNCFKKKMLKKVTEI